MIKSLKRDVVVKAQGLSSTWSRSKPNRVILLPLGKTLYFSLLGGLGKQF